MEEVVQTPGSLRDPSALSTALGTEPIPAWMVALSRGIRSAIRPAMARSTWSGTAGAS